MIMNLKFIVTLIFKCVLIFGIPYGINEVLTKFGYDLIKKFDIDLLHYILLCVILALFELRKSPEQKNPPKEDFAKAILMYVTYLKSSGRHKIVVELRNKLSHLFHLLNLQSDRERLGEIAFASAVATQDKLSKAEILIDDLGWSLHLQNRSLDAKRNITLALDELNQLIPQSIDEKERCEGAKAKAYRHLAFLSESENEESSNLANCEAIINTLLADTSLMESCASKIYCHQAQLLHGKAFLQVKRIGLHIKGTVMANEAHKIGVLNNAIQELEGALRLFKRIDDTERVIKTLLHYERFFDALGEKTKANAAKAEKESYLTQSGFDGSIQDGAITQSQLA